MGSLVQLYVLSILRMFQLSCVRNSWEKCNVLQGLSYVQTGVGAAILNK